MQQSMFQHLFGDGRQQQDNNQWTSSNLGQHSDLVATQLRGNLVADNRLADESSVGRQLPRNQTEVEIVVDQLQEGEQQQDVEVRQLAKVPTELFLERRQQITSWERICCYAVNDQVLRVMDLESGSNSLVHVSGEQDQSPVCILSLSKVAVDGWPLLACANSNSNYLSIRRVWETDIGHDVRDEELLKVELFGNKKMSKASFAWHPAMKLTFLIGCEDELFLYSTNLVLPNSSIKLMEGEAALARLSPQNGNITSVGFDNQGTRYWYGTDIGTFVLGTLTHDTLYDPQTVLCQFAVSPRIHLSWNIYGNMDNLHEINNAHDLNYNQNNGNINSNSNNGDQIWAITSNNESEIMVWEISQNSDPRKLQHIRLRKTQEQNGQQKGTYRSMFHREKSVLIVSEAMSVALYTLFWDQNLKRFDCFVAFKLAYSILSSCFLPSPPNSNELKLACRQSVGAQEYTVDCVLCVRQEGKRQEMMLSANSGDSNNRGQQPAVSASYGNNSVQNISVATSPLGFGDFSNLPLPSAVKDSIEPQTAQPKPGTSQQYGSIQLLQRQVPSPNQGGQEPTSNRAAPEQPNPNFFSTQAQTQPQVQAQQSLPASRPSTDLFQLLMPDIVSSPPTLTPNPPSSASYPSPVLLTTNAQQPPPAFQLPLTLHQSQGLVPGQGVAAKLNNEGQQVVGSSGEIQAGQTGGEDLQQILNTILAQQRQAEQRLALAVRKQSEVIGTQISDLKKEVVTHFSRIESQLQVEKGQQGKGVDAAQLKKVCELISRVAYKDIPESVEGAVKQGIKSGMKKFVGENENGQTVGQGVQISQEQITEAFKSAFGQVILPGFQDACGSIMEQMNNAMSTGWGGFVKGIDELKQLTQDNLQEGTMALKGVSDRLSAQTENIAALIQDATEAGSFGFQRGDGGESLTGVLTAEELEARHNPKVSIQRDIEQGRHDDAFRKCLSTKNQQLLAWLLSFVNPDTVLMGPSESQLCQPVIIGLIQRISIQINEVEVEQRERFFEWMQMLVLVLDETNRELQQHIKQYLEDAFASLEYHKNSEDPNTRKTAAIVLGMINMKLRSLEVVLGRSQ